MKASMDKAAQLRDLSWFRKNVHLLALALGAAGVVIALFAELPRSRGLFGLIAAGPVVAALVTMLRYSLSNGEPKSIAKIATECAWVCLSFGAAFFVMLPGTYYQVGSLVKGLLFLDGLALAAVGLYALVGIGKLGYSLTP